VSRHTDNDGAAVDERIANRLRQAELVTTGSPRREKTSIALDIAEHLAADGNFGVPRTVAPCREQLGKLEGSQIRETPPRGCQKDVGSDLACSHNQHEAAGYHPTNATNLRSHGYRFGKRHDEILFSHQGVFLAHAEFTACTSSLRLNSSDLMLVRR
jgi:hypothetical protein